MKVDVRDNHMEPALKALKKLMLKEGLFQILMNPSYFSLPGPSTIERRSVTWTRKHTFRTEPLITGCES
jgi:ribosomal protein S21